MTLPPELESVARSPQDWQLFTDFDGTLAPIVDDPAQAEALPEALDALRVLVEVLNDVVVLSGRPIAFLAERVPVQGVELVGQYGLEQLVDGRVVVDGRAVEHIPAVAAAREEAARQWPELAIERKGDIAFTLHWRTAPDREPPLEDLVALATRHGLVAVAGRKACELRTPAPVDKGTAMEDRLGVATIFIGDDLGDLRAFDVLDAECAQDSGTEAIRVAARSLEGPPELFERADLVVDGPRGVAELLRDLARAVSPSRPG